MTDVMAQRRRQIRDARVLAQAAADRERVECGVDIDYTAEYDRRVDAWLADPDNTATIGEMLATDERGADVLRRIIVDLDDRLRGITPEGDLIEDMRCAVRDLAERAAELAYEPICRDIDDDIRSSAHESRQMRRYGEVV